MTKGHRWKEIKEALACIEKDMVPIYTVEKPGFVSMLKTLDPKYEPPCHNYFGASLAPSVQLKHERRLQCSWKTTDQQNHAA